jgi:galactokinase
MTGGGFGGCTVTLAHKDCKDALVAAVAAGYPKATCFFTTPGAGAHKVTL